MNFLKIKFPDRKRFRRHSEMQRPRANCLKVILRCAALIIGLNVPVGVLRAATPPFQGKQITIAVGYSAGGGFDLYARLLAQYYGRHIPGDPTVIVQNVTGAGSLTLANRLYNVAPKDGTYIGMVAQTLPVDQVLGRPDTNFDFSKFNAIGRLATSGTVLVVWHTSTVSSIGDATKTSIAIASTGPSSETFIIPALLNNLVKTKFNIVRGYPGTQEMLLAMERGEVAGTAAAISSMKSQFYHYLNDNEVKVIVQDSVQRDPTFPNVPTTVEVAKTDEDRQIMKLFGVGSDIGRFFIAPPGTPPDRVAVLRRAFMDTISDPDFIAAAQKANIDLEPLSGEKLQALIESIGKPDPDLLKKAIAAEQWGG